MSIEVENLIHIPQLELRALGTGIISFSTFFDLRNLEYLIAP